MHPLHLPRRRLLPLPLLLLAATHDRPLAAATAAPALMLAQVYRPGLRLEDFWVSEKYDGVRGYWDGARLVLRGGGTVAAPAWFTAGWPAMPMDGELWAGRGGFARAVSTARQQQPSDAAWRAMRYMVFDLPGAPGDFDARLGVLRRLPGAAGPAWLEPVAHRRVADESALQALLRQTVAAGGEGLMLHRGGSAYQGRRSEDLLKLKPLLEAEALVLAHLPGQGRHAGRMGALAVRTPEGLRFRLGTGFSDAERAAPPAPGTWVVYQYRERTAAGLPRFASFLRLRSDADL